MNIGSGSGSPWRKDNVSFDESVDLASEFDVDDLAETHSSLRCDRKRRDCIPLLQMSSRG
jgi:hypothetical protein